MAAGRPSEFSYELWGCRAGLVFPTVNLLSYRQQWSSLEESRNPFATIVMAHLKAQETRHDSVERQTWKLWLTRRLYRLGYDRQRVIERTGRGGEERAETGRQLERRGDGVRRVGSQGLPVPG